MGIFFSYLLIVPRNKRWISTVLTPLAISSCNVLLQHRPSYPPLAPFSRILGLSGCRVVGFSNSRPLATSSRLGYILLSCLLIVPRNKRCISTVLLQHPLALLSRTILSDCQVVGLSGCQVVGLSDCRIVGLSDWVYSSLKLADCA